MGRWTSDAFEFFWSVGILGASVAFVVHLVRLWRHRHDKGVTLLQLLEFVTAAMGSISWPEPKPLAHGVHARVSTPGASSPGVHVRRRHAARRQAPVPPCPVRLRPAHRAPPPGREEDGGKVRRKRS